MNHREEAIRRNLVGGHCAIVPRRYTPALTKIEARHTRAHQVFWFSDGGIVQAIAFGGIDGALLVCEHMAGQELVGPLPLEARHG